MKLNLTLVINEIENERVNDEILMNIYAGGSLRDLYEWEIGMIQWQNEQTWEMVHYYESNYGLDYVENKLNWHIEEIPSFDGWFENYKKFFVF